ncbi:hypothetical protein [Spirochaeta dissipatitropha]
MKRLMLRMLGTAVFLLFLYSCASVPRISEDADPLALLPPDSVLVFSLPASAQREGVERLMPELYQGDMSAVMNRAARITIARRPVVVVEQIHMVLEGRYNSTMLFWGLSSRRGWQRMRLENGQRFYLHDRIAVMLVDSGYLYVLAGDFSSVELEAALNRALVPSELRSFPELAADQDFGRIWWKDTESLIGSEAMSIIPPLFRSSFDAEGSFDFYVHPEGSVSLEGSLLAGSEMTARVLNTSLRALLPQLLQTQSRPDIYREGRSVYLEDLRIESDIAEGWIRSMLEDIL